MKSLIVSVVLMCMVLYLGGCAAEFAGDWTGSGVDSEGNEFDFAAKVIDLGDSKYRVLILNSFDSVEKPMHVMDGVLKGNQFPHTSDEGLYTGGGTLAGDMFEGWYKGPVDGTYTMRRVVNHD